MPYPFGEWLAALDRPLPEAESVRLYLELRAPRRPVQPGLWNSAPPHRGVIASGQPDRQRVGGRASSDDLANTP